MSVADQMLQTSPADIGVDQAKLRACIEACFECAQACTACADACLNEQKVADLVSCIGKDLDCADICDTTGRILSRHAGYDPAVTRSVVEACATACKSCGDECQHHGEMGMTHCEVCGNACRRCEQACRELISSLG